MKLPPLSLQQWSIKQRLWAMGWLAIVTLVAASVLGFWNLYRNNTLTEKAMTEATLMIQAVDTARNAQVHFKKQVQEWKNVLLRGHDRELREKYWQGFEKEEKAVLEKLQQLKKYYEILRIDTVTIETAIKTHDELGVKYREAITAFTAGNLVTTFTTDKSVRGIDREPTDKIDLLVNIIEEAQNNRMQSVVLDIRSTFNWTVILSLSAALLAMGFLFAISWFTINSITQPITETIGIFQQISEDNLDNPVNQNRQDEIGEMWRALAMMQSKLKDRTEALNKANESLQKTLHEVQVVKEKQDGDYFLTSLLLRPLSTVNYTSPEVSVISIVEQKKKFHFRKWHKEIGGDINIADEITLRNKKYLVALNADAMGKSMQGAGGAIVFGAVFRSIIERTKMIPMVSALYPERWLKNTWTEIQKVFESFDGSMLVSSAIVLLDCETGTLYSINAEHPHAVLLRDGRADFLCDDYSSRKFGTLGEQQDLQISVTTLLPGDIVILGSDGRDDLMLVDADGNSKMNEDETLFLRLVTASEGDAEQLFNEIRNKGEITDDLSLLVIRYYGRQKKLAVNGQEEVKRVLADYQRGKHNMKPIEIKSVLQRLREDSPDHPEINRYYFLSLLNLKDYPAALSAGLDYSALKPGDDEALYLVSYAAKMSGDYETAADFGERLRLRRGYWVKNLINLADVYTIIKDFARAEKILGEISNVEPANEKAARIRQAVESGKLGRVK